MSDRATLLALAARVEAAVEADQRKVMLRALDKLRLENELHYRIVRLIEDGGYESAAIALMPAGFYWLVAYGQDSPEEPLGGARVFRIGEDWPRFTIEAATPGLAAFAAALRARAEDAGDE